MFRSTSLLRTCHITLFTRSPCSLCDTAKSVLQTVRQRTPFEYTEINVMSPGQEKWKSVYEFDTPVIHVDRADAGETSTKAPKLMHRFKEDEVEGLMERVESGKS